MRTQHGLAVFVLLLVHLTPCVLDAQELRGSRERPAALVPLYVSFSALQALDAHSTLTAVGRGARETNPLVRGAMDMPGGMVALKTGTAMGVIYLTEKLWKRNRVAAVVSMIALNGAYAAIAARNYQMSRFDD